MEREAFIEALDELGLGPDSPEIKGMDEGEFWWYIERPESEKIEASINMRNDDMNDANSTSAPACIIIKKLKASIMCTNDNFALSHLSSFRADFIAAQH